MMRVIPMKNYVIYGVLCLFTLLVVFYSVSWYQAKKDYLKENSLMLDFLSQVKEEELNSFLLENPDIVIYISEGTDNSYRSFEKKLKNFIVREEIKTDFIYLDSVQVADISVIVEKFFSSDLINKHIGLSCFPNVLIVENGKVIDVLYKINEEPDVKDVESFLKKYGVIEND